ncbi:hypothetical protein PUN28_014344 [Cardiocondyla obscurior]|uniref:Uncharacterized protein n=1 Tax=Cardiocondyla obscurior TaxID=286306 RepID=A0AAW2F4Z8_9HYME
MLLKVTAELALVRRKREENSFVFTETFSVRKTQVIIKETIKSVYNELIFSKRLGSICRNDFAPWRKQPDRLLASTEKRRSETSCLIVKAILGCVPGQSTFVSRLMPSKSRAHVFFDISEIAPISEARLFNRGVRFCIAHVSICNYVGTWLSLRNLDFVSNRISER